MEKYGFIYLWYDRKRKMFYLGSHWGTETDGYICSSNRMRDAYRGRPKDFKRRVLKRNISREQLLDEEHSWLRMISDNELGKKYYNLRKHKWGHWSTDTNKRLTVGQKISASPNRKENISKGNKGKVVSEETKKRLSKAVSKMMTPEHRKLLSERVTGFKHTEESRKKISEAGRGRPCSEETRKKISEANRKR